MNSRTVARLALRHGKKILGIEKVRIHFTWDARGSMGKCLLHKGGRGVPDIIINTGHPEHRDSPVEVIDTVLHELRHVMQAQRGVKDDAGIVGYLDSIHEVDARDFAARWRDEVYKRVAREM